MLSLTSHTHAHGRGAETSGKCAHLAEWPNYKAKQKKRNTTTIYTTREEGRETQRAKLLKEKLEHLPWL